MFTKNKKCLLLLCITFTSLIYKETAAQNINTPNKTGPLGAEVNTLSGNLFLTRNDVYVPSRGVDINGTFYYNSFNFDTNMGFGKGWNFMYNIFYKVDTAGGKTIFWGDAREDQYRLTAGMYKASNGIFDKLTEYQAGKFLITQLDGMKYYFDNATHKKVTKIEEPNGNFLTFTYTDTLLTKVTNTAGQFITFAYNGAGNLQTITDALTSPTRICTYTYDAAKNLKQVTDPLGGQTKYTYLVNGPIKTLSDKNNNTVDIIYYGDYTVSELIGCNKRQSFSYDTTLQETSVTDYVPNAENQVTKYQYKTFDNISWITGMTGNCCGYNMTFEYDNKGNKIKQKDANGNITTYTYDNNGNMLTMKDALNQTVTYTYSADYNRVTSYSDAKGFTSTMTYDAKGNLIQLVEPGNLIYTSTFNANGDIISSTDPKGNVFTYNYDALGNPTNVTGPNGYKATLGYDARGNLLAYTDARNNVSTMEYDILDRMKKITDPINNNVQLSYDAEGNATIIKNKNAENSLLKYDASNRVTQLMDEMGNKTNLSYDAMDNLTSVKNAVGVVTTFGYDKRNRISNIKDAVGNSSSFTYDTKDNITAAILPNGKQVNYTYDVLDRVKTITDNTGAITQLTYDKNDNITSIVNGTGATTLAEYDSLDRPKKITDPLGNSMQMTYDKNSNVVAATDRNGSTSTYTYDSLNRVKTVMDNNGSITTVGYDVQGNVVTLKDANNNITTYTYDSLNRVKRTIYPDAKYLEYTYDKKGNVTIKRLTDGTNINFTYDSLNRVVSKLLPDGQNYTYTYDAIGRVKTATNTAGAVTLNYDLLNRVVSESFNGRTVNYAYNTVGRTQTTIYPDSTIITKLFDTRNRLISISKNGNNVVSYAYNNADQVISKTLANGVVTTMQYDNANRLINYNTANGTIQNTNISYDNNWNKTALTRANTPTKSEQYVYDNGNRLTNFKRGIAGSPVLQNTYTYDALGNRTNANLNGTNTAYTTNNLNQLINSNNGIQNINFTYDNRGNLTYDGKYYKTYDAEGRLIKDSASVSNKLTYLYDAFGRRTQKSLNGNILNYTFAGLSQIEERDGTGAIKNKTIFDNFLTPLSNEKNGTNYFYHQNELGSVEAISNANGRTMEKYEYDVYGKQNIFDSLGNALTGSITGNRFGYTGQVYDSATARNKFLFREYNPETGTFNERDLIGYGDGMGMYQYVGNNPANGVDMFGLADDPCAGSKVPIPPIIPVANRIDGINTDLSNVNGALDLYLRKMRFERTLGLQMDKLKWELAYYKDLAKKLKTVGNKQGLRALNSIASNLNNELSTLSNARGAVTGTRNLIGAAGTGFGVIDLGVKTNIAYNTVMSANVGEETARQAVLDVAVSALQTAAGPAGAVYGIADAGVTKVTGKSFTRNIGYSTRFYTQWWYSGKRNYEDYEEPTSSETGFKIMKPTNCPQNPQGPGGTRKRYFKRYLPDGTEVDDSTEVVQAYDPNAILGPAGVTTAKKWVSVHDVLPYTILCENDKTATAPAKYVKIEYPIDAKQDAGTFYLGSFGFNNQVFSIPPNTFSYSKRLDVRDSLGLFVDVTAGLDVVNNKAFWEFQSIDPVTLLPTANPIKGFLLLQDSVQQNNGHAFVNFTIKPKQTDITLDTIHAEAKIVFDGNDTIPTNYHTNTVDAFAPTSHMNPLPANSPNPVTLSWTGTDDVGGCGVKSYTLYVSTNGVSFYILKSGITRTDTTIRLAQDSSYCFFVLATDSVGNMEALRQAEIKCTTISGGVLPVSWLYFRGTNQGKDNLLEWATTSEINTKEFKLERSFTGNTFTSITTLPAQRGNTNVYSYKDVSIDKLYSNVFFYRVKQIDIDGKFTYSNIVRLNYNVKEVLKSIVYPNPTQNIITITIGDKKLVGSMANLFDINGRKLEAIKIKAESQTIDLGKYTNGTYIVVLENKEVLRILKQ
jgi:RHS repeat-associated protein